MIKRLPKWSWVGCGMLALSAGMINSIALLGFSHQAATHVTGLFTQLAIHLSDFDLKSSATFLLVIVSFFSGSFICGLMIRDAHFQVGRRYGYALGLESALLFLSTYGFLHHFTWGAYFASAAAGLQNALVSHFSGAVVRTTHLTGILTDLGVSLGHMTLGRGEGEKQKIKLFLLLLSSFFVGCLVGTFGFRRWQTYFMLAPAILVGALSIGYELIRHNQKTDAIEKGTL